MPSCPVLIEVETLGAVLHGQILQLNMCQARVLPGDPLLLWSNVRLTVRFRYADVVYHLSGSTRESHPDQSFTFDFDKVTRQQMGAMQNQLREGGYLRSSNGAQNASESAGESEENREGCDAEDEESSDGLLHVQHAPSPSGSERRVHQRHDLQVNATVQKINSATSLRCQVLEISLGGCRIHTDRPNDYQIGDDVEIQFNSRGIPFRLVAQVQFQRADHVAGLQFMQMSTRTSERLVDLIRELADERTSSV